MPGLRRFYQSSADHIPATGGGQKEEGGERGQTRANAKTGGLLSPASRSPL